MAAYKRIVIKVGTKVITAKDRSLDKARVKELVDQIAAVQAKGTKVILVTSGAIGAGTGLLGLKKRPSRLAELQATASIGQNHLMHVYGEYFRAHGLLAGQILLTQEDFNDRSRYLNIKDTIDTLLHHNAVPIINENDTVSTDEIRCGDNDRLASLVADLCQADMLILLSDVDGLLDENGRVIDMVSEFGAKVSKLARASACDLGTGGMATKLEAARRATSAGIACVIANGKKKDTITRIMDGERVGTIFVRVEKARLLAKKRWIAFSSKPKGVICIDDGAAAAVLDRNKSLLASGIVAVEGHFDAGDVVAIATRDAKECARGVANYSSLEIGKIKGLKTAQIHEVLGRKGQDEVIHKDNLVII